jgi:adenylate cyclase
MIGSEVYGRSADYDTRSDAIVRVEAGRLRGRLREYYESTPGEPVEITIPKGSYAPEFRLLGPPEPVTVPEPDAPAAAPARKLAWGVWAALATAGVAIIIWWVGTKQPAPVRSIAVLPFVNLSGDPAVENFSDGISEEITANLASSTGVPVAARTSAWQFKNKAIDIQKAAAQLRVRSVLEGSVRYENGKYRVTVQLIEASSGYHLWAETYEREGKDSMLIQQELSAQIGRAVAERLGGKAQPGRVREPHAEAVSLFVEGTRLLNEPANRDWAGSVPPHLGQAIEKMRLATRVDPTYAKAWAGLAGALEYTSDYDPKNGDSLRLESKRAALRAIELDETNAEAHAVLGSLLLFREWNFKEAEPRLRRAIELNPRNPFPQREYADLLLMRGKIDDAIIEIKRAQSMDPLSPVLAAQHALLQYHAGRYDAAMADAARALSLRPNYRNAVWIQGLCHERKGEVRQAEEKFRALMKESPGESRASSALGHLLAATGRRTEAWKLRAAMLRQIEQGHAFYYPVALIHAGAGEWDAALDWLEKGAGKRDPSVPFIRVDPRLAAVHGHARVNAIMAALGF